MIDWTISVGNIIQILALLGAAYSMFIGLSWRIKSVETEIAKLANVVVTLAVQTTKLEHLQQRIEDLEKDKMTDLYPQMLKRHQI